MRKFFVEPSKTDPRVLVMVGGMDAQVLGKIHPTWKSDYNYLKWEWEPTWGINTTEAEAETIAREWGVSLPE